MRNLKARSNHIMLVHNFSERQMLNVIDNQLILNQQMQRFCTFCPITEILNKLLLCNRYCAHYISHDLLIATRQSKIIRSLLKNVLNR